MKIDHLRRLELDEENGPSFNRISEPESEFDEPQLRRPSWEPSTWIKPPTKAQLMAGR